LPESSEVPAFPGGIFNIFDFKLNSAKLVEVHAFNQTLPHDQTIRFQNRLETGGKGSRDKYQGINNYECYFK